MNKLKHKPTVTFTIIYRLIQQYLPGTCSGRLPDSDYVHYELETTNHLHQQLKPQGKYVSDQKLSPSTHLTKNHVKIGIKPQYENKPVTPPSPNQYHHSIL